MDKLILLKLLKEKIINRFNENIDAYEKLIHNKFSGIIFSSAAKEDYDILSIIDDIIESEANNE